MTEEGTGNLPTAATKAYDVLLWLINHVGKSPRSHRSHLPNKQRPFALSSSKRVRVEA